MIYTVGHTRSYEQYFRDQVSPKKKGKTIEYCGGSVWKTQEEARMFCPIGYSVYGIDADWFKDTEKSKEGEWHNLLIDVRLVKLKGK